MGSILVFLLGGLAMVASLVVIWRFRDTERPAPLRFDTDSPVGERFARVGSRTTGVLTAAVLAGLLVPGMGGRLMMRLLAATSPRSAQGRLTDAEEIVGEVTLGGTVGLVVFIGVFGGFLGLAGFMALRPFLPRRSLLAGLAGAGIGGGLLARPSGLIDPDNKDFTILSPAWLAVLSAMAVVVIFGLVSAVLIDRWAAHWPPIDRSPKGMLAALPGVAILVLGAFAVVPTIAVLLVVAFAVYVKPRLGDMNLDRISGVGRSVTGALALAGGGRMLYSAIEILRL